jgi:ABC-2 type transport system permease protein
VRKTWAIFEREIKSYFVSPIAYVVISLFIAVAGIFFYLILSSFVQRSFEMDMYARQWQQMSPPMNLHEWVTRPFFGNIATIALMILPLITMKLYAEEKKTGTIELLQTSPITNVQTLIGKYAASVALYIVMLMITFVYMLFLFAYGNPEINQIVSGYLGIFLIGSSYLAIGLLFSTLTDNQIVAAVSTIAVILVFWAIGWISNFLDPGVGKILSQFSLIDHLDDFEKGVIDTKNIVFYLSFIFMSLFLSYTSIESARWRGSR